MISCDRIVALRAHVPGKRVVTLEGRIIALENRVTELGTLLGQHGEAVWDLQHIAGVLKPAKKTKAKPKGK